MRLAYLTFVVLSTAAIGSASLQSDLNDFYSLIPKIRMSYIIGKHYLFDRNFRAAYNYLKSESFKRLMEEDYTKSPEIKEIVNYFGNGFDLSYIQNDFRSLNIPIGTPEDYANERTFSSFMDEVAEYLPHDKIRNLIRQKVNTIPQFADFYEKMMNPEYKEMVYRARNASSLAKVVKTLKENNIDIDHYLSVFFQLLQKWKL